MTREERKRFNRKKWRNSPKGKAYRKAWRAAFRKTPKGKALNKKAKLKWYASPQGKAWKARYYRSKMTEWFKKYNHGYYQAHKKKITKQKRADYHAKK